MENRPSSLPDYEARANGLWKVGLTTMPVILALLAGSVLANKVINGDKDKRSIRVTEREIPDSERSYGYLALRALSELPGDVVTAVGNVIGGDGGDSLNSDSWRAVENEVPTFEPLSPEVSRKRTKALLDFLEKGIAFPARLRLNEFGEIDYAKVSQEGMGSFHFSFDANGRIEGVSMKVNGTFAPMFAVETINGTTISLSYTESGTGARFELQLNGSQTSEPSKTGVRGIYFNGENLSYVGPQLD